MRKFDKLYVVDDDEIHQFIMKRIIEETSRVSEVMTFSNGQIAMEYLESAIYSPDLLPEIILLDLTMPVMDGWAFLDKYVALRPRVNKKIFIYLVSSSVNPADVERARSYSDVSDYIVKPVTKDKFVDLLNNIN